jgi:putative holliday junction resolvase
VNAAVTPPAIPEAGPLLGIDWGERRIGVAHCDAGQIIALPLTTLVRRSGRRFPLAQLRPHLDERMPVGVVVGLPLEPSGAEGESAARARAAGDLIGTKTGLPVVFLDERMTTARVRRAAAETGSGARAPIGVDQLAATVLLQQFLDSRRP